MTWTIDGPQGNEAVNGIGRWTRDGVLWLAGHFEGEGCLHQRASKADNPRYCGSHRTWSMSVHSTDRDVLDRYIEVFGVGKIYGPRIDVGHKPIWLWQTRSPREIYALCAAMLPFMHGRRSAVMREFMSYFAAYRYNGGVRRPLSEETRAKISASLRARRM